MTTYDLTYHVIWAVPEAVQVRVMVRPTETVWSRGLNINSGRATTLKKVINSLDYPGIPWTTTLKTLKLKLSLLKSNIVRLFTSCIYAEKRGIYHSFSDWFVWLVPTELKAEWCEHIIINTILCSTHRLNNRVFIKSMVLPKYQHFGHLKHL